MRRNDTILVMVECLSCLCKNPMKCILRFFFAIFCTNLIASTGEGWQSQRTLFWKGGRAYILKIWDQEEVWPKQLSTHQCTIHECNTERDESKFIRPRDPKKICSDLHCLHHLAVATLRPKVFLSSGYKSLEVKIV